MTQETGPATPSSPFHWLGFLSVESIFSVYHQYKYILIL